MLRRHLRCFTSLQGTDIPVQKHHPFMHMHTREGRFLGLLTLPYIFLNTLLLETERPINDIDTLRISGSYNLVERKPSGTRDTCMNSSRSTFSDYTISQNF